MDLAHYRAFRQFAYREALTGGPDPHITLGAHYASRWGGPLWTERVWWIACYIGPYDPNMGILIASTWSLQAVRQHPETFRTWIASTWSQWVIRRERRAARTPVKMANSLLSIATWLDKTAQTIGDEVATWTYDQWWDAITSHWLYFGRYGAYKALEAMYRANLAPMTPDIRAAGADSTRDGATLLYPEHAAWLRRGNRVGILRDVDALIAELAHDMTQPRDGMDVFPIAPTPYDMEVYLCTYPQALHGKYPGRSHDTLLQNWFKLRAQWVPESERGAVHGAVGYARLAKFPMIRATLFPDTCLGEVSGWTEQRPLLGETWQRHQYFWCDVLYNFQASVANLAQPVAR